MGAEPAPGYTVRSPLLVGAVAVTFMTTADMSAAGTPSTVGIDRVSLPLAPIGAILPVPVPTRVSRMRSGEIGV